MTVANGNSIATVKNKINAALAGRTIQAVLLDGQIELTNTAGDKIALSDDGHGTLDQLGFAIGNRLSESGVDVTQRQTIYTMDATGTHMFVNGGAAQAVGMTNTYTPKSGWRYGWSIASVTLDRYELTQGSSSWAGIDAAAVDPSPSSYDTHTVIGQPTLVPASDYYFIDADGALGAYLRDPATGTLDEVLTHTAPVVVDSWETSTWYGKHTYYKKFANEDTTKHTVTHTIEADLPIKVTFTGSQVGSDVTITSNGKGKVILADAILNETGNTRITSQADIEALTDTARVDGVKVTLTAVNGIGTDLDPIEVNLVDVAGASLKAVTSNGDIVIDQTGGDLKIEEVTAGGGHDVTLTAEDGAIIAATGGGTKTITGGSIVLDAEGGGIGTGTSGPLKISSGVTARDHVDITAAGSVYLEEVSTGDLRLNFVHADGEAWIKVDHGSVLDVNSNATRDERTEQELTSGLWSDLSLTNETGAQLKIQDTIDSLQNLKTHEYLSYWQFRTALANSLNVTPATIDIATIDFSQQSNLDALLTNQEKAFYQTFYEAQGQSIIDNGGSIAAQITTLEISRAAQLKDLDTRYAPVNGGVFNANYHYTLTQTEHDALVGSIKVWTKQELLYSVGAGLLQPVVNTQGENEDANIIAGKITILTPEGGVGRAEGEVLVNISNWTPVNATVDFVANSGGHGTITRTGGGSFAGFQAGMFISLDGTTPNKTTNGASYEILSVNGNLMTMVGTLTSGGSGVAVTISPVLSTEQRIALSSAERDDVAFLSQAPVTGTVSFANVVTGLITNGTITRADATTWTNLGFAVGQKLYVGGNTGNATDAGNYYAIKSIATLNGHSVITLADGETVTAETGVTIKIAPAVSNPLDLGPLSPVGGQNNVTVDFATVDGHSTITRKTAGSFLIDGFQVGKYVYIQD